MERLRLTIQYDGTFYAGYQVQPNGNTIQAEIEKALGKMHKGHIVKVTASGRTDAGVHALGQVVHFDTPLNVPLENWKRALNPILPDDIQVVSAERVSSDFHARYDTTGKEYRYFVRNHKDPDLFRRHYTHHVRADLDVEAMMRACQYIEGKHDFTSFCSPKSDVKGSKVRTIHEASVTRQESEIIFTFRGTGFLYNMVRILTGTLLEVGRHEREAEDLTRVIEAEHRDEAGNTAPPRGLFLWQVYYD
ncbi:tRNA pseudouridine(38-40) synthase TruA [Halobacillus litoralis]|uniref:tRNA pseudouridine synthase A n=1 Tax=Halobacillus litoralis TaxID=45668 RepID=A0A410MD96_9BACI|nr:tRNA pseudouridine(38-40) synthase TruA [Halobacillus litoralis]QAS52645.1 tRNA pseudouridine(38-40) synthase TruA [Halobacillus litoralis]